jgi:hypothetical protein
MTDLAMSQCRDGVQTFGAFDLLSHRLGNHAPSPRSATGNIVEHQILILAMGKEPKEGSALTSKQIRAPLVKCNWMSWQNLYQTIFCFTGQTHLTGLKTLSMNFANLTPVSV